MKVKSESEVAESCLTLIDPMDWGPPGSSVHGVSQARILEWVAIFYSNLPNSGIELMALASPALAGAMWEAQHIHTTVCKIDNQQEPTV